ncbi:PIN domain-containing protein [Methanospirillum sp.]|uniref:PIN domain-containing protein n=1 Tax=Methanospirillum sp. TaxID=45200 RepID=UPI00345DF245
MDVFVDTSVIIPAIIESSDSDLVRNFIQTTQYRLIISPLIYHEALYAGTKILLHERCGIESVPAVRNHIRKKGYIDMSDFIDCLNILMKDFTIYPDSKNTTIISHLAAKYHLLSGDALIVATCFEHNIHKLASFDSDFQKVSDISLLLQ